jgi:hypothetical protein
MTAADSFSSTLRTLSATRSSAQVACFDNLLYNEHTVGYPVPTIQFC